MEKKKNPLQCGRPGFSPWVGKIPEEGIVYPLQYSGLEISMDCYSPWSDKELDMAERLSLTHIKFSAQSPLCVELDKLIKEKF